MVNRLICSTSSSSGAGVVSGASQADRCPFPPAAPAYLQPEAGYSQSPGRLNQPGDILFLYVAQEDQGDMMVFRRYAASLINR